MAPRGRKRKAGTWRGDAAIDAMRAYGFDENVIRESIKELLEVYGDDQWLLIEEDRYDGLLHICLEKQRQQDESAEKQQQEVNAQEEEAKEQEQHVENGRDHVGSSSTSMIGSVTETTTQACPTDADSNTSETMMDSTPAPIHTEGSSPPGFALRSAEGAMNSRCGWLSSEEEPDQEEDGDDDDDDEMIQLTPEPLCEELEELLRKVRGQKRENKATRWDN